MTDKTEVMNTTNLNRKILNGCWWLTLIVIVISISGILFSLTKNSSAIVWERFITFVLIPQSTIIIVLFLMEFLTRKFKSMSDYIIIFGIFSMLHVHIFMAPTVEGIQYILFVPILVSALYFHNAIVYITGSACLISLISLYYFYTPLASQVSIREVLASIGVFVCCTFISGGIIKRGQYLLEHLEESIRNQKDLLVQNIMMDKASKLDPLTNLYNHKTFHEYLEKLIEQSESTHFPLQLAIIDIDNFKRVNDNYGHWVGDIILKRVGENIQSHMTSDDFASRYGGEEFAVILTDKDAEESYELIEKMRVSVSIMNHEELNDQPVTISIGMCNYSRDLGKEQFFKSADESLYQAKRNGKNQTMVAKNISY